MTDHVARINLDILWVTSKWLDCGSYCDFEAAFVNMWEIFLSLTDSLNATATLRRPQKNKASALADFSAPNRDSSDMRGLPLSWAAQKLFDFG